MGIATIELIAGEGLVISGSSEELEALGHALILKAKLKTNFDCTLKAGKQTPIKLKLAVEN